MKAYMYVQVKVKEVSKRMQLEAAGVTGDCSFLAHVLSSKWKRKRTDQNAALSSRASLAHFHPFSLSFHVFPSFLLFLCRFLSLHPVIRTDSLRAAHFKRCCYQATTGGTLFHK